MATEGSAFLNGYFSKFFVSDIDVHNGLFNGFGVFSTLLLRHQALSNYNIGCNHILDSYFFKFYTVESRYVKLG
jgi:hypothetical protein